MHRKCEVPHIRVSLSPEADRRDQTQHAAKLSIYPTVRGLEVDEIYRDEVIKCT